MFQYCLFRSEYSVKLFINKLYLVTEEDIDIEIESLEYQKKHDRSTYTSTEKEVGKDYNAFFLSLSAIFLVKYPFRRHNLPITI